MKQHTENSGKVYVKVHDVSDESGYPRIVVAICDEDALGKTYSEGEVRLEVNEEFFGGFIADVDEALDYIRQAYTGMLVGKNIVESAIRAGLIHPESVLRVNGVPYAQFVRM